MLNWAVTFLVIALIAGVFGFGGLAGTAAGMAKILFMVFIIQRDRAQALSRAIHLIIVKDMPVLQIRPLQYIMGFIII